MISQDALPEHLGGRYLDVRRKQSAKERDLVHVVVEVVHDLGDPSDPDEPALVTISPSFVILFFNLTNGTESQRYRVRLQWDSFSS
jgi:hypothetical protein